MVDADNRLVGIVSEGDLMRRPESGTERRPSWWLRLLMLPENDARRYVKTHGRHARDVMTQSLITAAEDDPVDEIAALLESRHIKRVPIMRDGKLVGIVSRADLLRSLASAGLSETADVDDGTLRKNVETAIREHVGAANILIGATVSGGVVELWGSAQDVALKDAARVAVENVPGVSKVVDHVSVFPPSLHAALWAE